MNNIDTQLCNQIKVTILGARGSIPVSGQRFFEYGGATSCVLVELGGRHAILLDAGSGIMNLPERIWRDYDTVHVFLSHFHIDHLLGIPMCGMLFCSEANVNFYAADATKLRSAIAQLMAEPLWPVRPDVFRAQVFYKTVGQQLTLGEGASVRISTMPLYHPGGSLAFRLDFAEKSIVYATDCEPDEAQAQALADFARATDLFFLDAQYTSEEEERFRGFGHIGIHTASQLIASSGAARGLLYHHAPEHSDEQLRELERRLQEQFSHISFAREGESITL